MSESYRALTSCGNEEREEKPSFRQSKSSFKNLTLTTNNLERCPTAYSYNTGNLTSRDSYYPNPFKLKKLIKTEISNDDLLLAHRLYRNSRST